MLFRRIGNRCLEGCAKLTGEKIEFSSSKGYQVLFPHNSERVVRSEVKSSEASTLEFCNNFSGSLIEKGEEIKKNHQHRIGRNSFF